MRRYCCCRRSVVSGCRFPTLPARRTSTSISAQRRCCFRRYRGRIACQDCENPIDKPAPEMGALLVDKPAQCWRISLTGFEVRLVGDLLSNETPSRAGLFYMAVGGAKLGNFDVVRDGRARDQMLLGQLSYQQQSAVFRRVDQLRGEAHPGTPGRSRRPVISARITIGSIAPWTRILP